MRSPDQVAAMSCPVCRVPLTMSDRQGIEIDYCPQCRGVWLDRGELDKIIERSLDSAPKAAPQPAPQAPPPQPAPYPQQGYAQPGYGQPGYGHQGGHGHYGYKKKKHWLEEIFD
jgi:uncharacterized protein